MKTRRDARIVDPYGTGYRVDVETAGEVAGGVAADPRRPVNPNVSPEGAVGLSWDELLEVYDGSGGGTSIDLTPLGLPSVQFIRFDVAVDAFLAIEIDAVVDAGGGPAADLSGDGVVGVDDLLIVIGAWGASGPGDLNGDGAVGVEDLLAILEAWT